MAMAARAAAAFCCGLLLAGCARRSTAIPAIRPDQHAALPADLRGNRYCEVIPIFWRGLLLEAEVYNTIGLNDCPVDRWNRLDGHQLAQRYGALRVRLNGPRYWLMNQIRAGADAGLARVVNFGGLQMRQRATIALNPLQMIRGERPFSPIRVQRNTVFIYRRGQMVYELISNRGEVFRMQSYTNTVDPELKERDLVRLGTRLMLPEGWRFRSRRLATDSALPARGEALVLQDSLQNSYQKLLPEPS